MSGSIFKPIGVSSPTDRSTKRSSEPRWHSGSLFSFSFDPMRLFLVLCLVFMAGVATSEALEVNGVRVHGHVHDVTVAEIREAITTGTSGFGSGITASEVDVVDRNQIRIYLAPRDLGWTLLSRQKTSLTEAPGYRRVTRIRWECRCKGVDDPDVLTVIRGADQAFVFPVSTPDKPRRDKRHQRLLDPAARRKVVQILGNRFSWWQGGYSLIQTREEPPNIGLVFRKGKDEVVLFFESGFDSYTGHVNGTLNGQHISDLLDTKPSKQMQEWRRRYAQLELAAR
jgi:hypothetical protein